MSKSDTAIEESPRLLSREDRLAFTPVHVVWELTLACDLKCRHCGSRAGKRRLDELSTEECVDLIRQMARMGTRAITLIGGEAYLRRDWIEIVREIISQGIYCTMQTGGLHLTEQQIRLACEAGLRGIGVSVDGKADVHDYLRGVQGSFDAAMTTLRRISRQGVSASVNTQITSLVIPQLSELMDLFIAAGATNWQLQLTVAMGRAADNPEILLQPYDLARLMPLLAELFERGAEKGLLLQPGNNIGYFGPYEGLLRGNGDDRIHWLSCNAGQNSIGIEADGTIKGCPSLATVSYAGGNIRDLSLTEIWQTPQLKFTRSSRKDSLWGFCRSCYYADSCQAGCTWTSDSLLGRPGNNPYCHHRVIELAKQGLRERIVLVEPAPGNSFDHGRFELVLETLDGNYPSQKQLLENTVSTKSSVITPLVQIASSKKTAVAEPRQRKPPRLIICRGCNRHVNLGTVTCPHCGGNVRTLAFSHRSELQEARRTYRQLIRALEGSEIVDLLDQR